MMEIELPEGGRSWSVAIRLPRKQERGAFQVFNAHFFHVYQTNDEGRLNKIVNWQRQTNLSELKSLSFN